MFARSYIDEHGGIVHLHKPTTIYSENDKNLQIVMNENKSEIKFLEVMIENREKNINFLLLDFQAIWISNNSQI